MSEYVGKHIFTQKLEVDRRVKKRGPVLGFMLSFYYVKKLKRTVS